MNDLLPCPFCGCTINLIEASNGHESHFVFCDGCGAEGPAAKDRPYAVERWNTRAQPPAMTGRDDEHN
uniref:Restriction alleviation protein, Lar family n=1 Tax=Ralstonia pickettii (strain 12D) TaxID=428406 RepID=C6BC92_RALP1